MNRSTFDDERRMQPHMNKVYRAWGYDVDRSKGCKLYDVILTNPKNNKRVSIEEKFLFTDREYDQLIVEIVQDAKTGDLGWLYHCKAQWLNWVYSPATRKDAPRNFTLIAWKPFKDRVIDLLGEKPWQSMSIVTQHYGTTINFPVKWAPLLKSKLAYKYNYGDFANGL